MKGIYKEVIFVFVLILSLFGLIMLIQPVQATDDGLIKSHRVSTVHKEVIELVTQADIDRWAELRNRKQIYEILSNGLILHEDGWVYNIHGYRIIHNTTIKSWALSSNRGLIDMSRAWQDAWV